MRRLKLLLVSLLSLACLAAAPAGVAGAQAFGNPFDRACTGAAAASAACKTSGNDPITGKNGILYRVARIFALLTGIGAVILIIIGGLMYTTAGGDAGKANSARQMILGAVIGLVIVALAETIVSITINAIN
jgi:hypothetical protein